MNPSNPSLRIHYLSDQAQEFLYSTFMARLGHQTLFYTDGKVHPRLSVAWYFDELSEQDAARIRLEDLLTVSPFALGVQARDILRKISDCDLIQASGLHALWALFSGRPFIYHVFGGDVTRWPFLEETEGDRIRAFMMRTILKEATLILGLNHSKRDPQVIANLGLDPAKIRNWCFPLDAEFFKPLSESERQETRAYYTSSDAYVILLASQLKMWPTPQLNYSKGSDIFARGIKKFLDDSQKKDIVFWVVRHGPQVAEFQELAQNIGLEPYIRWITPQKKQKLVALYHAADVVLDQISPDIANHGYLAIEAMACAKPVLGYIDHDFRREFCKLPFIPNVNVRSVEEVAARLENLYHQPAERERIGQTGRDFILKHHHWPKSCARLLEIYREAIALHQPIKRSPI